MGESSATVWWILLSIWGYCGRFMSSISAVWRTRSGTCICPGRSGLLCLLMGSIIQSGVLPGERDAASLQLIRNVVNYHREALDMHCAISEIFVLSLPFSSRLIRRKINLSSMKNCGSSLDFDMKIKSFGVLFGLLLLGGIRGKSGKSCSSN